MSDAEKTPQTPKSKKPTKQDKQIQALTADLQRVQADFQNYSRRVEVEKQQAKETGQRQAIMALLPVIDNIERAIKYVPEDLKENAWAQSVFGLTKHLEKSLDSLQLKRIDATPGTVFNPELHEAIQFDEEAKGETEVVAEDLQAGYQLGGSVMRHAMVKVTRQ